MAKLKNEPFEILLYTNEIFLMKLRDKTYFEFV